MKVLAFLQNAWFKPGTNPDTIKRYLTNQRFRRLVLARCMTGRRLMTAFGNHYESIHWDNASTGVGVMASSKLPYNIKHMHKVIEENQPDCIICFGGVATNGFIDIMANFASESLYDPLKPWKKWPHGMEWHMFRHPNAFGLRQAELDEFAKVIITKYLSVQDNQIKV